MINECTDVAQLEDAEGTSSQRIRMTRGAMVVAPHKWVERFMFPILGDRS